LKGGPWNQFSPKASTARRISASSPLTSAISSAGWTRSWMVSQGYCATPSRLRSDEGPPPSRQTA